MCRVWHVGRLRQTWLSRSRQRSQARTDDAQPLQQGYLAIDATPCCIRSLIRTRMQTAVTFPAAPSCLHAACRHCSLWPPARDKRVLYEHLILGGQNEERRMAGKVEGAGRTEAPTEHSPPERDAVGACPKELCAGQSRCPWQWSQGTERTLGCTPRQKVGRSRLMSIRDAREPRGVGTGGI